MGQPSARQRLAAQDQLTRGLGETIGCMMIKDNGLILVRHLVKLSPSLPH